MTIEITYGHNYFEPIDSHSDDLALRLTASSKDALNETLPPIKLPMETILKKSADSQRPNSESDAEAAANGFLDLERVRTKKSLHCKDDRLSLQELNSSSQNGSPPSGNVIDRSFHPVIKETASLLNHKVSLAVVVVAITLMTGCEETIKQKQQRQQQAQQTQAQHQQELQVQNARHQRELQMTQQAAAATATSQTLHSQQALAEQARKDGFSAGEATGRLAAMSDIERREEKARQHGHKTGLIEGQDQGRDEGLVEGEKIGYAKAATTEREKGQKQGEIYGEIKGRSEAIKEAEVEIEQAEEKGETRGIKLGRIEGIEEGKEYQRRQDYYRVLSVALSTSAAFAAGLMFLYTRLAPTSARAVQKRLEEERLRQDEQRALDRQDRGRLMDIFEEHVRLEKQEQVNDTAANDNDNQSLGIVRG